MEKPELTSKIINKMFKVKKGVTQITFEGELVESGATVKATLDDIPEDIRELIDLGIYSEEEALAKCTVNGGKERRMILTKPYIKLVGDDENKTPQIQKFEEVFSEEDLLLDCLVAKEEEEEDDELPFAEESVDADNESSSDEDAELAALLDALN